MRGIPDEALMFPPREIQSFIHDDRSSHSSSTLTTISVTISPSFPPLLIGPPQTAADREFEEVEAWHGSAIATCFCGIMEREEGEHFEIAEV